MRATRVMQGDIDALWGVLDQRAKSRGRGLAAAGHFDGMIAVTFEVPAAKISSEEETLSAHTLWNVSDRAFV